MNERINELAEQAMQFSSKNGGWRISTHVPNDFKEKFAELIVRECADLFDDDPESETKYTGVGCRGMIKHYFGVEQ